MTDKHISGGNLTTGRHSFSPVISILRMGEAAGLVEDLDIKAPHH
jgi:hypothetical protein